MTGAIMSDKRIVRAAAVQIAPDLERAGGTLTRFARRSTRRLEKASS
jgi:cation diffusion facilitator CzcD-associated flavoprotein CzcO